MKIKFWGVRGSIATPLAANEIEDKIEKVLQLSLNRNLKSKKEIKAFLDSIPPYLKGPYGGNTTCLEVRDQEDNLFILDAGTGIARLGNTLNASGFTKKPLFIYLSHTHWDHIQGLPFFVPLYVPENRITFLSSFDDMEERLRYQFRFSHFPVPWEGLQSRRKFVKLEEGKKYRIGNFILRTRKMNHPGDSYAISIMEEGKKFIFTSDVEFNFEVLARLNEYMDFFEKADILVFDSQYTYPDLVRKIDWGHSSGSQGVDVAVKTGAKRLILWHYDPSYSDPMIRALTKEAIQYKRIAHKRAKLHIEQAREGRMLII